MAATRGSTFSAVPAARWRVGAATPKRAIATEAALVGHPWDEATADAAVRILANEFAPIGDMRASAGYRRAVLSNLFRRFRLETGGAAVLTRIEQVAE